MIDKLLYLQHTVATLHATCHLARMQTNSEQFGILSKHLSYKCLGGRPITEITWKILVCFDANLLEPIKKILTV